MKKLYLISGFFLIASMGNAQNFLKKADNMLSGQDRPDSVLVSNYHGQWETKGKIVYTYDDNVNTRQSTGYYRDTETQPWQPNGMIYDVYNENGKLVRQVSLAWNSVTSTYDNSSDAKYTYNASGQISSWNYMSWNSETFKWDSLNKDTYIYPGEGDSLELLKLQWNSEHQNWDSAYKSEIKLTAAGNENYGSAFKWNTEENNWESWYDYRYYFDENQNDTLYTSFHHNNEDIYEMFFKIRTQYTDEGLKKSESSFQLIGGVWKGQGKSDFTYSESGNLTQKIYSEWDNHTSDFMELMKETYFYTEATGLQSIDQNIVTVYPNPSSDYITVRTFNSSFSALIILYDLSGNLLLEHRITDREHISIHHIPAGVYLYEVRQDSRNVARGKITISK